MLRPLLHSLLLGTRWQLETGESEGENEDEKQMRGEAEHSSPESPNRKIIRAWIEKIEDDQLIQNRRHIDRRERNGERSKDRVASAEKIECANAADARMHSVVAVAAVVAA